MPVVDYLSVLRGPSSSCVFLRGFLFLAFVDNSQWFQASPAPALPGGSFESETGFVSNKGCLLLVEPFAIFVVGYDILLANVMFRS